MMFQVCVKLIIWFLEYTYYRHRSPYKYRWGVLKVEFNPSGDRAPKTGEIDNCKYDKICDSKFSKSKYIEKNTGEGYDFYTRDPTSFFKGFYIAIILSIIFWFTFFTLMFFYGT